MSKLHKLLMLLLLSGWCAAQGLQGLDPLGVFPALVAVHTDRMCCGNLGVLTEGEHHVSPGAVVDTKQRLVVVWHVPFIAEYFKTITVIFFDGRQEKGRLLYVDPVFGFSLIKLDSLPRGVRALDLETTDQTSGVWMYSFSGNPAFGWIAYRAQCQRRAGGRLPTVQSQLGSKHFSNILISQKGTFVGCVLHGSINTHMCCSVSDPYFVPAHFILDAVRAVREGRAFQPGYIDVSWEQMSFRQALDSGFLTQELLKNIKTGGTPRHFVYVVCDDPQGVLKRGDVVCSVNGVKPGWDLMYAAPRLGRDVHVEVVRNNKVLSLTMKPRFFPKEKEGCVVTEDVCAGFVPPCVAFFLVSSAWCEDPVFYFFKQQRGLNVGQFWKHAYGLLSMHFSLRVSHGQKSIKDVAQLLQKEPALFMRVREKKHIPPMEFLQKEETFLPGDLL